MCCGFWLDRKLLLRRSCGVDAVGARGGLGLLLACQLGQALANSRGSNEDGHMQDAGYLLSIYLHLALASQRRRRPHVRDRLLLIAGAIASEMGLEPIASYCRHLVLLHNPNHMIRRWATLGAALNEEDFRCILKQLRRRYPNERAERMLQSLGIELGNERAAYYSDYEYAAALLGVTPDDLHQKFGGE